MLFNSLQFLLFFPIVVLFYFIIPQQVRWVWLLVASYYFYMCWNAKYALLMATSTAITWLSGLLIALAMLVSYQGRLRDFVSLCLCTLAANVWLLALLARLLFDGGSEEAAFLFFALATLACLAATVSGLLAVQRRLRAEAASAEDAAGGQP